MAQEDKDLLLRDLCARLPYKIQCRIKYIINNETTEGEDVEQETDDEITEILIKDQKVKTDWVDEFYDISCIKLYLRPMSSMTEEEVKEFAALESIDVLGGDIKITSVKLSVDAIDWLNSHHFDYRGLIPMGLALEAPEGMYNIKEE
jgi:hypothetical protein